MFFGIDPSLSGTAVVALDDKARLLDCVRITTDPSDSWGKRIVRIIDIRNSVKSFMYGMVMNDVADLMMSTVVLEGYSYGSRFRSHHLGELGYALREFLYLIVDFGHIIIPPPAVVKKFITGKGNAAKPFVAVDIVKQFNLKFDNHDLSDACACALFGLATVHPEHFEDYQLEVLNEYIGNL